MVNTEVYIRIRWGNKAQSISEASNEVVKLLLFLAQHDTVYENLFFVTGEEKKDFHFKSISSLNVKEFSDKICEKYLESNRRELEKFNRGLVINSCFREPVGFLLSFYVSKPPSETFAVRITIGKYGKANFPNQVFLTFPSKYFKDGIWFRRIFEYLVENFEPEKGGIYPEFTAKLKGNPSEYPGWISYYASSFELPTIPAKIEKQDFKNGSLFFVTRNDFDVQNNEHIERWKEFYLSFLEKYPLE